MQSSDLGYDGIQQAPEDKYRPHGINVTDKFHKLIKFLMQLDSSSLVISSHIVTARL